MDRIAKIHQKNQVFSKKGITDFSSTNVYERRLGFHLITTTKSGMVTKFRRLCHIVDKDTRQ